MNDAVQWTDALVKSAPDKFIAEKVGLAVQQLLEMDAELLVRDLHERTAFRDSVGCSFRTHHTLRDRAASAAIPTGDEALLDWW